MNPIRFTGTTYYLPQRHTNRQAFLQDLERASLGRKVTLRHFVYEKGENQRDVFALSHAGIHDSEYLALGNRFDMVPIQETGREYHDREETPQVRSFVDNILPEGWRFSDMQKFISRDSLKTFHLKTLVTEE